MEHEIQYLKEKCKKFKGEDRKFFQEEAETVEFNKKTLETNIENQFVTVQQYLNDMKKYKKLVEKLRTEATKKLGLKHETTQRLEKRIDLLTSEIAEIEQGMQE